MGLDKFRATTARTPCQSWLDEMNAWRGVSEDDQQRYVFSFPYRSAAAAAAEELPELHKYSQARIRTRPGVEPAFFVELGFVAPGAGRHLPPDPENPIDRRKSTRQHPVRTIFECNPNKLAHGWKGLQGLVDWIFGDCPDLAISRLDFNAETGVSVSYLWESMRVPTKRRAQDVGTDLHRTKGAETFYLGRPPHRYRVYDKKQEMVFRGEDVSYLPAVLTRVEVETRHDHCPVKLLSELENIRDYRPFRNVQFLEVPAYYDYKTDPAGSIRRRLFHALKDDWGSHTAVRILNSQRHFSRDFGALTVHNETLKQQLEANHAATLERFFQNQSADIPAVYGAA